MGKLYGHHHLLQGIRLSHREKHGKRSDLVSDVSGLNLPQPHGGCVIFSKWPLWDSVSSLVKQDQSTLPHWECIRVKWANVFKIHSTLRACANIYWAPTMWQALFYILACLILRTILYERSHWLASFCRWENWGSERLSHLCKVTQLGMLEQSSNPGNLAPEPALLTKGTQ